VQKRPGAELIDTDIEGQPCNQNCISEEAAISYLRVVHFDRTSFRRLANSKRRHTI